MYTDLSKINWTLVVEERLRFERRIDPDFSSQVADNQSRLDSRFRVGWDFKAGKQWSGQFRYQYIDSTFWRPTFNNSDDGGDMSLGNVSYTFDKSTVTLGRQVVTKGGRRLIDVSDYSQRSKAFDVVRFKTPKWDAFAGRIGITSNIRDHSKVDMVSYNWGSAGETMFIYHFDDKTNVNDYTIDHRWVQDFGKLNAEAEGSLQRGRVAGLDLESFWAHARLQFATDKKLSFYSEANVASGGADGSKQHLFDPLYGNGHAPYGLMDLQGLRNMRHLEFGAQYKFSKAFSGLASLNNYGLYDPADGWYNTGGSINRRPGGTLKDATGHSGRDVGHEWNLAFTWVPNARDTFGFELGVFEPGDFVKHMVGPGASNEIYGLFSYTARF